MASNVRHPLVRATLDGNALNGVIAAHVEGNNHLAADRFGVKFAAKSVAIDSLQTPGSKLEISLGLDGSWASVITGVVDAIVYDPVEGTIDVDGRDLAALFIEAQTDETFANRTSSEIASLLAGRHGLSADVQQTTTAVGRYFESERDRVALGQFARITTEWDLLAVLAGYEGFDVSVQGTTLRFGAPDPGLVSLISPSDCLHLRLEHCVGLARPIAVSVKSWSASAAKATVTTTESSGVGPLLTRSIVRPNLTEDDAARLANRTIADLKRHEWTAYVRMPGDLSLSSRSRVRFSGTQSSFDRAYTVSRISRSLDVRSGFTQSLVLQGVP